MQKPDCLSCLERPTCKAPCEAVEAWINQDRTGLEHNIRYLPPAVIDAINPEKICETWHEPIVLGRREKYLLKKMRMTERQLECAIMYWLEGQKVDDIAISLHVTQQAVSFFLSGARQKMLKKLKIYARFSKQK